MKIQTFLPLITYPDANSDSLAADATSLAAHLGADLHATVFSADIPHVSNLLLRALYVELPELIREAEQMSRKHGERLLDLVRAEAAERSVDLETSTAPLSVLGETARYFDISLLGWEAGNSAARAAAQMAVFGSGRPVVLLPASAEARPIKHLAIAWDGSRVAARAVADALPFLQRALRTTVLTVVDEKPLKDKDIAERLANGLRKRGMAADGLSINAEDSAIGISLQEHALERGADMLVMGGYGHSVVRDFVLGGATEDVLEDLRLPVLLSH